MTLPPGIDDTINALVEGCRSKDKEVDVETVRSKMIERLTKDFDKYRNDWPKVRNQILTVAGLSGRLAALYAALDNEDVVRWTHARKGLRDGQAECVLTVGLILAKHCENADFEHD